MKKGQVKSLNDRIGEYIFYEVLEGRLEGSPEAWLEVKDKDGNPVKITVKKAKKGQK